MERCFLLDNHTHGGDAAENPLHLFPGLPNIPGTLPMVFRGSNLGRLLDSASPDVGHLLQEIRLVSRWNCRKDMMVGSPVSPSRKPENKIT